ncbi:terpenoid cyclases/Protein prenyltransferase [Daedalea quercina L-15889]|uniref:Terpenoid cyclases/Protein prenyltransferase n=1 Tax=Daedalea quercina L-15889 TaxID=1314783 RepID=A0A165NLV4_9APHY|nr:terpenoid cyclases/Protein prenyltransferase [Daedalea quercina L-15889]
MSESSSLPRLNRNGHAKLAQLCLSGLPFTQVDLDSSRLAIIFYCLGTLDLLGVLGTKILEAQRARWRDWIWEQQTHGNYGAGFRPSPYMTAEDHNSEREYTEYDGPHLIMTYTALMSLAILRDDFAKLNRAGILTFIRLCQQDDGSFSALPNGGEADLRTTYCAFVICSLLGDWSGMDLERAVAYIRRCSSEEGGYGQTPDGEALGGTTYCALASLKLAPATSTSHWELHNTSAERLRTIRWLTANQSSSGGFCGRTNKIADACYCFWCGASLSMLDAGEFVDTAALASFLGQCQFKFGGIAKAPGERADPYHTYLSLAALALFQSPNTDESWRLPRLDPLWNATLETACWAREHIPATKSNS